MSAGRRHDPADAGCDDVSRDTARRARTGPNGAGHAAGGHDGTRFDDATARPTDASR